VRFTTAEKAGNQVEGLGTDNNMPIRDTNLLGATTTMPNKVVSFETLKWICLKSFTALAPDRFKGFWRD
jgi:hypothetical protein